MRFLPLLLALWASASHADARLSSEITLPIGIKGGLSAIEVQNSGNSAVVLSDRGVILTLDLVRDNGVLKGVRHTGQADLHNPQGRVLQRPAYDSEGLSITPDGRLIVSFESTPRVWSYTDPAGPAAPYARNPAFADLQPNSGLEALATGPDGTIYTVPERSGRYDRPFPVYRYRNDWDVAFEIPRRGKFLVTGADIGPDGLFYLLERDFVGLGFKTRVRRFDMNGGAEETLIETTTGTHSNLEGISVWEDDQGRIRLTMVSDNNENLFIGTYITEYILY